MEIKQEIKKEIKHEVEKEARPRSKRGPQPAPECISLVSSEESPMTKEFNEQKRKRQAARAAQSG